MTLLVQSKSNPAHGPVDGVRVATAACGIRYRDRSDVLLVELSESTTIAGVFTRSSTASAPVDWCRSVLPRGRARAILVNAGNANAFSGVAGVEAVSQLVKTTAPLVACRHDEVYVASTGVIGEPLPYERITSVLSSLHQALSPHGWEQAARAIMTTDTFPKLCTRDTTIDGVPVRLTGIAKGSGMIAPDMATLLAFVFTDASLPPSVLQPLLAQGADDSFNCVTVDGDTSTSDTLLLCATGRASHSPIDSLEDPRLSSFREALYDLLRNLAIQVARDGEGATKLITVTVTGAASSLAARRIAFSVGNSPLVKTAIAGEDANWGRIVMAVGKSGERADRDQLSIRMGGVLVAERGTRAAGYDESAVTEHLRKRDVMLEIDVGVGSGSATIWTCDLTHGYIDINGSYRS